MVEVTNSETLQEIVKGSRLQGSTIPKVLGNQIIPVMECNPKLLRRSTQSFSFSRSTTGSGAIVALNPRMDYFITGIHLSFTSNVLSDSTLAYLSIVQNGLVLRYALRKTTLVAADLVSDSTYFYPIKVDRGSTISIVLSFTVGVDVCEGFIAGYYDETSLA